MSESDQGEKTEEATQQRREDFRKRGQVAQTKELASVLSLLGAILSVWALGRFFLIEIQEVFTLAFTEQLVAAARDGDYLSSFTYAAKKAMYVVSPVLGIMFVMSFISSVAQVGFLVNEEAMQLKLERLNPVDGLKRVFSIRSVVEGIKAVFKVSIVTAIVYALVQSEIVVVPNLISYDVEQLMTFIGKMSLKLLAGVCLFMVILAGIDYLFQRWDLEKKMKMTKQEVKQEQKNREGDPLIKARIRRVQREMANRRMMEEVPKADVIITNPTHIAVALKYSELMISPVLVAKGEGPIAEKIKELAKKNGVPVVENKPLARTIYKTLKIGATIPRELYTAVAEVLSYVFKLKRKKGKV